MAADNSQREMADNPRINHNIDLTTALGALQLNNPVLTASGTCGFGRELAERYELSELGALIVKGITVEPRSGNPSPRIAETPAGMLNSIGLENPGLEGFIREELPWLAEVKPPVLANISGHSISDFSRLAEGLADREEIAGLEVNVSCPNIGAGGLAFGTDPEMVARVTAAVRDYYSGFILIKLTPAAGDILSVAQSARDAGADALTVCNTMPGMEIDVETQAPVLGNTYGGLSGPALQPIALKLVYQLAQADILPILGGGGIMSGRDAIKFLLAGARAVSVGTATLLDPLAPVRIKRGIIDYLEEQNCSSLEGIIGQALR